MIESIVHISFTLEVSFSPKKLMSTIRKFQFLENDHLHDKYQKIINWILSDLNIKFIDISNINITIENEWSNGLLFGSEC